MSILFKYRSLFPITISYILIFLSLSNMQALIVSDVIIVPLGHVGKILATAGAAQLWAMIILIVPAAILADFLGRSIMIVATFVGYALYAAALPHVTSVNEYMGMRIAFGAVTASYAGSSVALMIDRSDSSNRISALSIFLAIQGVLGALALSFINNLPLLYTRLGFNSKDALSLFCISISILCVLVALYTFYFCESEHESRKTQKVLQRSAWLSLKTMLQFAISELRALSTGAGKLRTCALLLTGGLQKSDHVIFQTFIAAWLVSYRKGFVQNPLHYMSDSGAVLITLLLFSAVGPLIAGLFLAYINKIKGIILFSSISAMCILTVGASSAPHIPVLILDAAVLGTSESIVTVLSQAMIGDMTEYSNRATFGGTYAFFGNVVLSFTLIIAGFIFDSKGARFAFLALGIANFSIITAIALLMSIGASYKRSGH